MQLERSRSVAHDDAVLHRVAWLSSPLFRAAATWMVALGAFRASGADSLLRSTSMVESWLMRPVHAEQLVASVQSLLVQAMASCVPTLLLLAAGIVTLHHTWRSRWSAAWEGPVGETARTPGRGARLVLVLFQSAGMLVAFALCTWWSVYAVLPQLVLDPRSDAASLAAATSTAAWNIAWCLGALLLVLAAVDVALRYQLTRPDEETIAQIERQNRRNADGAPEVRRQRRAVHECWVPRRG